MSIEKALYDYLSTKAGVVAQVSTRVYPDIAPESAVYPFITVTITNETHDHHMQGGSGLANPTIQLDVWAETLPTRVAAAEAVRLSLDGFRGAMGTDSLSIRSCFLVNKSNFQEQDAEGRGNPVYRSSMDFSIWHVETVPTL